MYRRYLVVSLKIVTAVLAVATFTVGCSEDENPKAKVVFDSSISRGTHKADECDKTGLWFTIGSLGTPAAGRTDPNDRESPLVDPPRPVENGGSDQQGEVDLSCSVASEGDGFRVRATATLSGATGGSVTVIGLFRRTGEQPNITLSMTKKGETYTANNCVAKFDAAAGQEVESGRVWATIDCADAKYSNDPGKACATRAEIRLENCSQ